MGLFKRQPDEQRAAHDGWKTIRRGGIKGLGTEIDVTKAETIPQVIGVYNRLSQSIAQAPLGTYRELDDDTYEKVDSPDWVKKPNRTSTRFDWMEQAAQQMLYYGNVFLLESKARVRGKTITEYFVVHFDDVTVEEPQQYGGQAKYFVSGQDVTKKLKHIAYNAPAGCVMGRSPIQQARDHVLGALAAGTYRRDLYENGMNLAGVIEAQGDVTPETAQATVDMFYESHRAGAQGGTPIGYLANATWKTVTLTPSDAEYVESQKWDAQVWSTLLGVPSNWLDASAGSWAGTGLEVMNLVYLQFTLGPLAKRIEEALSALLPDGLCVKFNLDVVLEISMKERYDAYGKAITAGWMTRNEVRLLEGRKPIEGADELITPMWMLDKGVFEKKQVEELEKVEKENDQIGKTPNEENDE